MEGEISFSMVWVARHSETLVKDGSIETHYKSEIIIMFVLEKIEVLE